MHGGSVRSSTSPSPREQWVFPVAERYGAWRKPWSSSLRILAPMPGARPYPVAPGDGVVIAVVTPGL